MARVRAGAQVSFEDRGRSRILLRYKGLLNVCGEPATDRFFIVAAHLIVVGLLGLFGDIHLR